jgi:hypothetical protein
VTQSTSDGPGLSVMPQQSMQHLDTTQATWWPHWQRGMRLPHLSRQCTCHDSFMSHANLTGATQEGQILQICFGRVHISKLFFKNAKIQKKSTGYFHLPALSFPMCRDDIKQDAGCVVCLLYVPWLITVTCSPSVLFFVVKFF